MKKLTGKYAMVTGASSGIGRDIALSLARRNCNLILVARRKDKLHALKQEIIQNHTIDVKIISMDLSTSQSPEELYATIQKEGISVDILVNNAGFGIYGYFMDTPWAKEQEMLNLLILNIVHLTKLFAAEMVSRKSGYIMQISSVGAFQPTPTYSCYSAAKSFVLNFGVALNAEISNTGVSCSVLCPGITATEFQQTAGQAKETFYMKITKMTSRKVAETGISKMLKRKAIIIPGFANAYSSVIVGLMPKRWAAAMALFVMGKP
jgi:uncharacterized protein